MPSWCCSAIDDTWHDQLQGFIWATVSGNHRTSVLLPQLLTLQDQQRINPYQLLGPTGIIIAGIRTNFSTIFKIFWAVKLQTWTVILSANIKLFKAAKIHYVITVQFDYPLSYISSKEYEVEEKRNKNSFTAKKTIVYETFINTALIAHHTQITEQFKCVIHNGASRKPS